eukprot:GFKZ01013882.1.p1 GENE.GFKZ01013882.1~~GFKZ01013882.1.p1  ORF type:complete len:479 (-),score=46.15 GFKZ01013882.1:393-1829(-)
MAAYPLIPLAARGPRRNRRLLTQFRKRFPSLTSRTTLYIWLTCLLLLLILRDRVFTTQLTSQASFLEGRPASSLPTGTIAHQYPAAYFGVNARFLFYTSTYGQFNNQLVSLINALFVARRADAVLILPYTKLGKESTWDLRLAGLPKAARVKRELVGDYFNYSRLALHEHVVRPTQFFASVDAVDLFSRANLIVNYRSGNAYRKLFTQRAAQVALEKHIRPVEVSSPFHERGRVENVCDFSVEGTLRSVNGLGRNGRFTMLPIMLRRHNLNCSVEEKDWITLRRALVPRNEFLGVVDRFLSTLRRPVLAIHLRVFLNGDLDNFSAESYVSMLEHKFSEQLGEAQTLFLAYSPSSHISREIFGLLGRRFSGDVVDGSRIGKHFRIEDEAYRSLALSAVLMDMWVCVKSDMFIGRLGSSLSWNTVYWRQGLQEEYSLNKSLVAHPLWYSLPDFTTTGATRNEGNLLGSNSATSKAEIEER